MRVLVTGGGGFIGVHVVDALVGAGHEVVVVDRRRPENDRWPEGVTLRVHDICDVDAMRDAAKGVDAVSHQAAMVGLGVDFGDVVDYARTNDLGTATLLRALHDTHFEGRLVLASSMVVYGEGRYRCTMHGLVAPGPRDAGDLARGRWEPQCPRCGGALHAEAVPESAPADPRNVYAATKLHQEHLCAVFGRDRGATVIALRYHNVYGPQMPFDTPYAGVAALFRTAIAQERAPIVFEDGGQQRDFVHVRDVARANLLALDDDSSWSGPLNIASGTPRSVLDLATALWRAAGSATPPPEVVPRFRAGDVRHVFASPAAAQARLGFRAQVPFAVGMGELATAPMADQTRFTALG